MISTFKCMFRLIALAGLFGSSITYAQSRQTGNVTSPIRIEEAATSHPAEYYFPEAKPSIILNQAPAKTETPKLASAENEVDGTTIYGIVKQGSAYNIVSTVAEPSAKLTVKVKGSAGMAYEGSVYSGGRLYAIANIAGVVFTAYTYDVETWNMLGSKKIQNPYIVSLTCNQADNTIYGCFTNANASAYDFGTLDITTGNKTIISALPQRFVGMAADNGGIIYGIAIDGNLYRIDAKSGATALVGATGQTVTDAPQGATFDVENNRMYWTAGNTIYRIDTQSGAATSVGDIEGAAITAWNGIFTISSKAGSTPSWISQLDIDFKRDDLTGNINFILPDKSTSSEQLNGTLDYHILVDDKEAATGQGQPGASISHQLSVAEGTHKFTVYASNQGTKGPELYKSTFIGHDTPSAPSRPVITAPDVKNIVVKWQPVTSGINFGYIDVDAIRYTVTRQPDNKVIAKSITECSVHDTTITNMGYYTYQVVATDGVKESAVRSSERTLLGEDVGVTPPFKYLFDNKEGFGLFTEYDANGDGYKWKYSEEQDIVWYEVNPNADSDDWLISPGLNLEAGKSYKLRLHLTSTARMLPHYFEIYYGKGPNPKDLTVPIVKRFGFIVRTDVDTWFKCEESGIKFIGLRIVTPAVEDALMINNFEVTEGHTDGCPDVVSNVNVKAAPMGALSATLSFTLPTKTFAGATLTSISSVTVTNTSTGKSFDVSSPEPGTSVEITDNEPADGENTYSIVCANADGESVATEISTWVGVDLPGLPRNVQWMQIGDKKIRLTWDAPEGGQHGGYVDISNLQYYIVNPSTGEVLSKNCETTSFEFEREMPSIQEMLSLGVCGRNEKGLGVAVRSNQAPYGVGYSCPFYESFEDAGVHSTPWMVQQPEGYNSCNIITDIFGIPVTSYDDTGMAVFTTLSKGSTRLELPLLDISTLKAPALKMWVYFIGNNSRLKVRGNITSGLNWVDLKEIPNDGGKNGWHLVTVPLDHFRGEKRLQLGIEMYVDETPEYYYYVLVDKLSVIDNPDYDLLMSNMTVPERVNAGRSFTSSVTITNAGAKRVESYRINATINGSVAAVKECPAIEPDETVTVDVTIPLSSNATSMELIMAVECDGDADPNNDAWISRDVQVVRSRYPQPQHLINTSDDNSTVVLEWSEAASRYQATVTDDLESLEHGSVGGIDVTLNTQTRQIEAKVTEGKIGPYKVVDNDKQLTATVQLMINRLPHDREGMACQVIDLNQLPGITDFSTIWAAHSGSTLLCFWQSRTADDNYDTANDDWLILPRLAEDDPRISFWAKSLTSKDGLESFEIMISMDGDAISDFESYQSVVNVPAGYATSANAGYTFYEFELPEGTQYAAIRYNAAGSTALLVDDLSYTPDENYKDLHLVGYNVYRNGVKINAQPLQEPRFTDRPTESGDYLYNVTTLFLEGESRYSNTVRVNGYHSSVDNIGTDDSIRIDVIDRTIEVHGAAGQALSLYATDGRLLRSVDVATDTERFDAAPGMFVVRVANVARVVIVK